jgi:hypothetical protein
MPEQPGSDEITVIKETHEKIVEVSRDAVFCSKGSPNERFQDRHIVEQSDSQNEIRSSTLDRLNT